MLEPEDDSDDPIAMMDATSATAHLTFSAVNNNVPWIILSVQS